MLCETVRPGVECSFWQKTGCSYTNGHCLPVVEKCEGCQRVKRFGDNEFCTSFAEPEKKWGRGACNFATHVKASVDKSGQVKVNPLKASKRAAKGR